MRFLHTGDIHLDSAFCSSDAVAAEKKREGQRRTLGKIFDLARKKGCEMVLISGDLFDGRYVSPDTEKYVRRVLESAGVPVIIAPGNHDPYTQGSFYSKTDLPENVYVFSASQLQRFDFPELRTSVYGYAFTSPSLTYSPLAGESGAEDAQPIRLLCAHADLDSPVSRYCPLTVGDIKGLGINYAALGHIHNREKDDSDGDTAIRYCGFPQGRSFDETGEGGVLIADVSEDGGVSVERIAVSEQIYESIEIDMSGLSDRGEMSARIRERVAACVADKSVFLRVSLVGTADRDEMPELGALKEELISERLLSVDIRDMTVPLADIESLRADRTLRGEFYRALYSGLISEDPAVREKNAYALRIGLAAIEGRKIFEDGEGL